MQSRKCKGLFFAGEVIDADGPCGGYNLQIAWSTGALAARSAVEFAHPEKKTTSRPIRSLSEDYQSSVRKEEAGKPA
jgi:hypothetical protein